MKAKLDTSVMPTACFAPPLTDEKLATYQKLADGLPKSRGALRDAFRECLKAVKLWWDLPVSKGADDPKLQLIHRGKPASVALTSLTPDLQDKLFDAIPWQYEIDGIQSLFDAIPVEEKEFRDAAFHLLWHVKELNADREPLTQDKLPE